MQLRGLVITATIIYHCAICKVYIHCLASILQQSSGMASAVRHG